MRQLNKLRLSDNIKELYFRSSILSILLFDITGMFGNLTVADKSKLRRVIKYGAKITSLSDCDLDQCCHDLYLRQLKSVMRDESHPLNKHIDFLPSGIRLRSQKNRLCRTQNAFMAQAIQTFNK